MKLKLADRIIILNQLLPKEGNILEQTIIKGIIKDVELTEEELKEFEIRSLPSGGLQWNDKGKEAEFDLNLSKERYDIIIQTIDKLDKEKKITQQILDTVIKLKEYKPE